MELCFGDENENVAVSPSKITPNIDDKRNSETNIEVAEPKRRRCQPRDEDNISIDPNSRTPIWLFCHECNNMSIRVYIYPPTRYMESLLLHIEGHMELIYSKVSNTHHRYANFDFKQFLNILKSTSRFCKMNL